MTGRPDTTWWISKDELGAFSLLLNHGLDTDTMIRISFRHADNILSELKSGGLLIDILCSHTRGSGARILKVLGRYMSFSQAVDAASEIEKSSGKLEKKLLQNTAYPLFLFCFSFFMIWFFAQSILPQMASYAEDSSVFLLIGIIKLAYTGLFLGLLLMFLLFLWYQSPLPAPRLLESFILSIPFIRSIYTYQFSVLLKTLLAAGLNTQQMQQILQHCRFLKSVQVIFPILNKSLQQGSDFFHALKSCRIIDPSFLFFLQSGMEVMALSPLIELYCTQTLFKVEAGIKKASLVIQLISYVCVGVLVISVYQIMLMPLGMLSGL